MEGLGKNLLKYFLEGLAVALAAYYIPKRNNTLAEVVMIAATAGVTFLILDMFAPAIGSGARLGAGIGIGFKQVGFEGYDGKQGEHAEQH
jgi:hypothetical protein